MKEQTTYFFAAAVRARAHVCVVWLCFCFWTRHRVVREHNLLTPMDPVLCLFLA